MDLRHAGCRGGKTRPGRAGAGQQQMDRRAGKGAGNLRQSFHSLLLAHVSGVKGDHSALRQVQFLAQGTRRRSDRRRVDPIGKQQTALGGDTLLANRFTMAGVMLLTHSKRRSRQDSIANAARRNRPPETMPRAKAASISKSWIWSKARVPATRPPTALRGRYQGRRDGDQNLGAEGERSPQGHRQAADGEARQMDQPAQAPGPARNIKRATIDLAPSMIRGANAMTNGPGRCAIRDNRAGM